MILNYKIINNVILFVIVLELSSHYWRILSRLVTKSIQQGIMIKDNIDQYDKIDSDIYCVYNNSGKKLSPRKDRKYTQSLQFDAGFKKI